MIDKSKATGLLFHTIGSPIGSGEGFPPAEIIEEITEYAFKNRVGLLFLDECISRGIELGPKAVEMHRSLSARREATDKVVVKLAKKLDEVALDDWVLFKSIKPFASTPNDTDWFPLDPSRHKELCEHLMADGQFRLLEVAPRQTTLIEASGEGITDTTKKGGVYYIDCYVCPSTDYFVYFDPRKLSKHVRQTSILGYNVPILAPHAELAAIMFHNVFPERSFSVESYYLIKRYLDLIKDGSSLEEFVDVCREHKMELAAACNLSLVRDIDLYQFGVVDNDVLNVMSSLGYSDLRIKEFDPMGSFPYEFPNRFFWGSFLKKQRDVTALRSTGTQLLHMLNPVFFVDVVKIIWRRSVRGGVYEQN